jgi:NhaP-type Na+/H+ or K+/H+ antiporter
MMLVFGVVTVILLVTALASGIVERFPLSFPLMFLGLKLVLGKQGFGAIELGPHDQILEVTAALTLALVLFLDAAQLQIKELGRRWLVPTLFLGSGTALVISLGAVPLALLIGFGWVIAFISGAILASTDPVVLREILRDRRIPRSVRQVLRIEAGMNDIVALPVILVLIAVATGDVGGGGQWVSFLLKLLVLGPAIGFAIGGVGAWFMRQLRNRWRPTSVRSES